MKMGKAIVVGGSIAGVSCAHALIAAGWQVVVLEKSLGPTPTTTTTATGSSSPTGAGLGLDPFSCDIITSWLPHSADDPDPHPLLSLTLPLSIDQNQAVDIEKKGHIHIHRRRILTRDEEFNFRAAHWGDLHRLLLNSLDPEILMWGHHFLSFKAVAAAASVTVTVKAQLHGTSQIVELHGDLLIAADGCQSSIRQTFFPNHTLRYAGYCAWRGVLDYSENADLETAIRKVYPDMGKCLYFDLGPNTHCVLYELLNKRINWIWYINQPEPETKGNSVTLKVSQEMIEKMVDDANKFWVPELVMLMKATKEPFLNVIYDSDPLHKIVFDNNVVLVGDAAHPTTPHCLRSTNMSLLDAMTIGKCLEKWGRDDLESALSEYQSIRLPMVSKQVLHARKVGRIKQGLDVQGRQAFDPNKASPEDCYEIQQKNAPFFSYIPELLRN